MVAIKKGSPLISPKQNYYKSGRETITSCSIEYVSRTEIKLINRTEIEEILVCVDDNIIA